jgi:hypothetical protein
MSTFVPSYVIKHSDFQLLLKRRNENAKKTTPPKKKKKIVKKKKEIVPPQPAFEEDPNLPPDVQIQPTVAKGLTTSSRLNRFQKKYKKPDSLSSKPTPMDSSLHFKPLKEDEVLKNFPSGLREKVSNLIEFIQTQISPQILTWDKGTLEIKIFDNAVSKTNIVDIFKYLFGYGSSWASNYPKTDVQDHVKRDVLKKLKIIPRGADDVFFILKEKKENISRIFQFHHEYIINLLRYHFLIRQDPDDPEILRQLSEQEYSEFKHLAEDQRKIYDNLFITAAAPSEGATKKETPSEGTTKKETPIAKRLEFSPQEFSTPSTSISAPNLTWENEPLEKILDPKLTQAQAKRNYLSALTENYNLRKDIKAPTAYTPDRLSKTPASKRSRRKILHKKK